MIKHFDGNLDVLMQVLIEHRLKAWIPTNGWFYVLTIENTIDVEDRVD